MHCDLHVCCSSARLKAAVLVHHLTELLGSPLCLKQSGGHLVDGGLLGTRQLLLLTQLLLQILDSILLHIDRCVRLSMRGWAGWSRASRRPWAVYLLHLALRVVAGRVVAGFVVVAGVVVGSGVVVGPLVEVNWPVA